jgi:excinuclease ABC subunit C
MEPADHTVAGWCGGILVQFQISGGRVCDWSQRACGMPGAARAQAATPHAWGEFMQRNAELAANMDAGSTRSGAAHASLPGTG